MIKKVLLVVLLVGFIGVLAWGGVIWTQAKVGEDAGSDQSGGRWREDGTTNINGNSDNSGPQIRREGDHEGGEDCDEGQESWGFQDDRTNSEDGQGTGYRGGKNSGSGYSSGRSGEPLDESEIEALNLALDDEYHALAVYQSVIAEFGEVDPFVDITQSEQRHIDALLNQFSKHSLPVPENTWLGHIPPLESLQSACQLGVEAEIANVELYQKLFSMVDDPGVIQVFNNLSTASQESHLPAFQACQ